MDFQLVHNKHLMRSSHEASSANHNHAMTRLYMESMADIEDYEMCAIFDADFDPSPVGPSKGPYNGHSNPLKREPDPHILGT